MKVSGVSNFNPEKKILDYVVGDDVIPRGCKKPCSVLTVSRFCWERARTV
jgi:hypothetical protein